MQVCLLSLLISTAAFAESLQTRNVILVTLDGVRSQEMFSGLDETIAGHDSKKVYSEIAEVRERYPGETPEHRRAALMPHFWKELVPQGQVFGNAAYDNHVLVQNAVDLVVARLCSRR